MYRHSKLYAVISYITWIGFIIAMVGRDPSDPLVRRHLNQALIINIVETVSRVFSRIGGLFGSLGSLLDIACLILFFDGPLPRVQRRRAAAALHRGDRADPLTRRVA